MSEASVKSAVLLVDNGTLEPAAILRLREIAAALGERIQHVVEPVSLLHSDRVPTEQLDGQAAEVLEAALNQRCARGIFEFTILPLFIGPSRALSEYLPQVIERVMIDFPQLQVRVAQPLYTANDDRIAQILEAQVRKLLDTGITRGVRARVALVDHGSPVREVSEVRNALSARLAELLGDAVAGVSPCSMERRPGKEYDFNEPLLAKLLVTQPWHDGPVVVAHLFLLPGRHAGAGGDIARICREAEAAVSGRLLTLRAGLLGDHPWLLDILADRYH